MDIAALTQEEAEQLLLALNMRLEQIRLEARNAQGARTTRIEDAITALDGLLGPEGTEPGTENIRAVRGFSGEVMAENAAVALPLAFHGLEILTTVVRDLAASIAQDK